ncbi:adenylate/guanylate cyclase domain-containing protein [Roseibium sediminicola]|uniref:Adenylate/guanylate cyclase domain-containing protein n=1 Tax=Roseibium sediminicola TaxID=2933272 RepID=A0ABT0H2D0_9HYPH|nr:adenylate/guanylate cyclase domain-containing protein [Roseibium sp. CAU 1639]MCK7615829.1 adenylate/guanylate cyclase domain-containing protein [Roseibium sp. CAU 1639]
MIRTRRLHITPTLATVIGTFVFATAALVLLVQATTSEKVVRQLGGALINIGMHSLEQAFTAQIKAVEEASRFTTLALTTGNILMRKPQEMADYLFGTLSAMEHVSFVIVADRNGNFIQIDRGRGDGILVPQFVPTTDETHVLAGLIASSAAKTRPFWTGPAYYPQRQHTYISHVQPILSEDGNAYEGLVLVAMSMERLSEITKDISTELVRVFMINPQSYGLIAHPALSEVFGELAPNAPLIALEKVPDDFLKTLKSTVAVDATGYGIRDGHELRAGYDTAGDKRFVVIQSPELGPTGLPISFGAHFPAQVLEQPFEQLTDAILIGVALLGLSLVGAGFLAHRIGQPIRRAAVGARAVADLELDTVEQLPGSFVRELDDLASGFNSMVGGLAAFSRYVPKTLVRKLLREGRADAPPEERKVAVLFTDIAGFTSVSEGLSASETAAFVNHHLSLLGAEITREGGTIDKYIGDSVMAFWGAPDRLANPAEPAARAALAMARAIHADNQKRTAQGKAPVRIRIGLHMGPLVVGDIGAPERVNYTVIGDTVNVASRLESLGKEIDDSAEVIILASNEIAQNLDDTIECQPIGPHTVKGKTEALSVVRLLA